MIFRTKIPRIEPLNLLMAGTPDLAHDGVTILPLPKGEGRGEGEGGLLIPVESYRQNAAKWVFPLLGEGGLPTKILHLSHNPF